MNTTTRTVGDVTIVDISGRIVLGSESAALRSLVCNLLSEGHKKILLNLAEVNYIDSSGLGHLVSSFTTVRKQQGELKLLILTNKVHDLSKSRNCIPSSTFETTRPRPFGHSISRRGYLFE